MFAISARLARIAGAATLVGLCVAGLTGCAMVVAGNENQSLMEARLPKEPDFKDAVFVLKAPPYAEFVYLMAQQFPESYVVVLPAEFPNGPGDLGRAGRASRIFSSSMSSDVPETVETKGNGGRTLTAPDGSRARAASPGDHILRTDPSNGQSITIPCVRHTLPRVLVFHHLRMTAADEIPEVLSGERVISMAWDAEPMPSEWVGASDGKSALMFLYQLPTYLTLGLAWPPPWPTRLLTEDFRQVLHVESANETPVTIKATQEAESGFLVGFLWVLVPFIVPNNRSYIVGDNWGGQAELSPGGWANCLEQMLQRPEVLRHGRATADGQADGRTAWFEKNYGTSGFTVQPLPKHSSSLTAGYCLFKDNSTPGSPSFVWRGLFADGNRLDMAIDRSDHILPE